MEREDKIKGQINEMYQGKQLVFPEKNPILLSLSLQIGDKERGTLNSVGDIYYAPFTGNLLQFSATSLTVQDPMNAILTLKGSEYTLDYIDIAGSPKLFVNDPDFAPFNLLVALSTMYVLSPDTTNMIEHHMTISLDSLWYNSYGVTSVKTNYYVKTVLHYVNDYTKATEDNGEKTVYHETKGGDTHAFRTTLGIVHKDSHAEALMRLTKAIKNLHKIQAITFDVTNDFSTDNVRSYLLRVNHLLANYISYYTALSIAKQITLS